MTPRHAARRCELCGGACRWGKRFCCPEHYHRAQTHDLPLDEIVEQFARGVGLKTIRHRYQVSQGTLWNRMQAAGLSFPPRWSRKLVE